jgi:hypothetical protein
VFQDASFNVTTIEKRESTSACFTKTRLSQHLDPLRGFCESDAEEFQQK